MPFVNEVEKVANAADAVTSRWKTWALAFGLIVVAAAGVVAVVKFFF